MRILYLLDFALQWTAIGLEIYCLYIQCVFCTLVEKTVYRELGWLNAFSKERRGISVKRWPTPSPYNSSISHEAKKSISQAPNNKLNVQFQHIQTMTLFLVLFSHEIPCWPLLVQVWSNSVRRTLHCVPPERARNHQIALQSSEDRWLCWGWGCTHR